MRLLIASWAVRAATALSGNGPFLARNGAFPSVLAGRHWYDMTMFLRYRGLLMVDRDAVRRESGRAMTERYRELTSSSPGWYSVIVAGALDPGWADHFDGMRFEREVPGETRLVGYVSDQAALQGVLELLYGLGLPILSVTRLEDGDPSSAKDPSARSDQTVD